MRRFMDKRVMLHAAVAGVVLAALCIPYLRASTPSPALLQLRVAFLFPVFILLLQATLAWTPLAGGQSAAAPPERPAAWGWILPAIAALAAVRFGILDPLIERLRPGYLPATRAEWLVTLPWVACFQPLTMIAGVYAFTARFSRNPAVCVAAVVAVRIASVFPQWPDQPPATLAFFLVTGGASALLFGWIYRTGRLPALAVAAFILECRHLLRLTC